MGATFVAWAQKDHYDQQTQILEQAVLQGGQNLDDLLARMRATGETAIYFSGTRLDSRYALGSNDLGTAISVLPEDGTKAAVPGYHPGSTEVYVVFQGGIVMEAVVGAELETHDCGQFGVIVLPPGKCHRVRHDPNRKAASFIVKTNPHHDPKVIRCNDCRRYARNNECPLFRSWRQEL